MSLETNIVVETYEDWELEMAELTTLLEQMRKDLNIVLEDD